DHAPHTPRRGYSGAGPSPRGTAMNALPTASLAILALALTACGDPTEAYTPVDELPSAEEPAAAAGPAAPERIDAGPLSDGSLSDGRLADDPAPEPLPPTDPEVPPPLDPVPPLDEATRPPPVDPTLEDDSGSEGPPTPAA